MIVVIVNVSKTYRNMPMIDACRRAWSHITCSDLENQRSGNNARFLVGVAKDKLVGFFKINRCFEDLEENGRIAFDLEECDVVQILQISSQLLPPVLRTYPRPVIKSF